MRRKMVKIKTVFFRPFFKSNIIKRGGVDDSDLLWQIVETCDRISQLYRSRKGKMKKYIIILIHNFPFVK